MFARRLASLAGLTVALLLSGCATRDTAPAAPTRIPEAGSTAQLRPGDILTVALQGVPDPSTNNVQIDEQGLITLPFIGSIKAAGTTLAELSRRVRETYLSRRIYTAVDVSIVVTERFIYVGGEVQRPGRIGWTPDLTVAKAIQAAGGFTLYAKETAVSLVRDQTAYSVDVKAARRDPSRDPRLVPGDSLQVARSPF